MRTFETYTDLKAAILALSPEEFLAAVELTPQLAEEILGHDPVNRDLRKSNVQKLKREIEGGHWDVRKAPALRFLPDGRLADGQHRCRAVIEAGRSILVNMAVITDTIGLDQGAIRSLPDQLRIYATMADKQERELAAAVTKSICRIPGASDRELLEFFKGNRNFILDCVRKPLSWLSDKEPSVVAVMKPSLLAVTRAQEIVLYEEPEAEVDELLFDMVNGGVTAPAGSPRRALATQVWDEMQKAHTKRGARLKDVVKWTRAALRYKREGVVKNAILARFPGDRKKRAKTAKAA